MSHSLTPTERRTRLERIAYMSAAVAASGFASAGAHATTCQPWNASTAYVAGDTVTEAGKTYKANWWTQGNDPATSSGATGTGQPWTITTSCGATPPAPLPTPPAPVPTPPRRFRPRPRRPPCRRRRPAPAPAPTCAAWKASTAYNGGATVTEGGKIYKANWWTQGDDPATHNGATGSGQPWTITSSCSATPTPPAPPPPRPRRPRRRPDAAHPAGAARADAAGSAAVRRRAARPRPDGLLAELQQRRARADHRPGADHLRHHRGGLRRRHRRAGPDQLRDRLRA